MEGPQLARAERARWHGPGPAGDAAPFNTGPHAAADDRLLSQFSLEPPRHGAEARGFHRDALRASGPVPVYLHLCRPHGAEEDRTRESSLSGGPYFAADFIRPVGVSTGKRRTVAEIETVIDRQTHRLRAIHRRRRQERSHRRRHRNHLGWDTIYEPERQPRHLPRQPHLERRLGRLRALRLGYVLRRHAGLVGDRDLAYANALEILREETAAGLRAQLCARRRLEELRPLRAAGRRHHRARPIQQVSRPLVP